MATILIIEDRPVDRKLLASILRSGGHEVIEASDGQKALVSIVGRRPDLVVSDILMPTMDGYEFVRRMRAIPATSAIPVIFYTATYHEREARALAHRCGVSEILTKPTSSAVMLATVDAALSTGTRSTTIDADVFAHEHVRLLGEALQTRVDRLEMNRQQMSAILEAAGHIASEQHAPALFRSLASEARQVTLAQYAVTGLLTETGEAAPTLYTSGFDQDIANSLPTPTLADSIMGPVVRERRHVRTRNPDAMPEALGLPANQPAISSLLSVPIATQERTYGWLTLRNKLGTDEFSDLDEVAAAALATHAAIAYENARIVHDVDRRVEERVRAAREEERAQLSRMMHDDVAQTLTAARMDLDWVLKRVADPHHGHTDLIAAVEAISGRLSETIQAVQKISRELRSEFLGIGLVAALEVEREAFERRSGIRCRLTIATDSLDLDPRQTSSAFRIVQQALTNVAQHSGATRATVTVKRSATGLRISIADNGRGISQAALSSRSSLGLIGMRERASLIGAKIMVLRRTPRGTMVRLVIPTAD